MEIDEFNRKLFLSLIIEFDPEWNAQSFEVLVGVRVKMKHLSTIEMSLIRLRGIVLVVAVE